MTNMTEQEYQGSLTMFGAHMAWKRLSSDTRFRDVSFGTMLTDEHNRGAVNAAINYARAFSSRTDHGMLLMGAVGVGKTHMCYAIARAILKKRFAVVLKNVERWFEDLTLAYRTHSLGEESSLILPLRHTDLLILDDIGSRRTLSEHTTTRLFNLVNYRWERRKPIVATTSLTLRELYTFLGEFTYSRLVDDICSGHVFELGGQDRRRSYIQGGEHDREAGNLGTPQGC